MSAFSLANLAVGVAVVLVGAVLLVSRARVLPFVRGRFDKVYREDQLSEEEIARRLPKMSAVVVVVACGFAVFGTALIVIGAVSTR
ncbi:hypothetical protein [Microbacterium sp.]|uniref:hypothetical protein n=1 Tax=Microbacterium sp. TaxID=51671 RepID=UPI0026397928|nr:hypothetical protein [Microbacterium sp.]MCV0335926.1 hypothetical protein [Microbacterium sp.]MCV0377339.1 hypothetical protein [Microbacterium sp.]MCV0390773.1 hypothetical protein [Microbacterium sp.]MCV0419676.1 hypothetical protein [Microbacterium sp.]MCV0422613.1 hypothetical protein [Microbacterium sp.]